MEEDGIVLGWSAPGRPEEGEIKRLTGHESVVRECVAQQIDLVAEGCRQWITWDWRVREQSLGRWGRWPAVDFDWSQSKVIAGLIALRVEDWQLWGVLMVSIINGDAKPVGAGRRLRVDIYFEGSDPGSASRPISRSKGSVIGLTAPVITDTEQLISKRELTLIGGEDAPVPSYGHNLAGSGITGNIESTDK